MRSDLSEMRLTVQGTEFVIPNWHKRRLAVLAAIMNPHDGQFARHAKWNTAVSVDYSLIAVPLMDDAQAG